MRQDLVDNIYWLGHASFLLKVGNKNIYIDPYSIPEGLPKADIILITHPHFDHLSPQDIEKVERKGTVVVLPKESKDKLTHPNAVYMVPGQEVTLGEFVIRTIPAYNLEKSFHPKEKGWVGYIVETPIGSVYHAGDTDLIPEMEGIKVDVALLPVGGTYTMDWAQAVEAAKKMDVGVAIPMHWGKIVGSSRDAELFAKNFEKALIKKAGYEKE